MHISSVGSSFPATMKQDVCSVGCSRQGPGPLTPAPQMWAFGDKKSLRSLPSQLWLAHQCCLGPVRTDRSCWMCLVPVGRVLTVGVDWTKSNSSVFREALEMQIGIRVGSWKSPFLCPSACSSVSQPGCNESGQLEQTVPGEGLPHEPLQN